MRRLLGRSTLIEHFRVDGVELDYVEEGVGVPVVFSHGGASDLRYWEPQRQAFAERHRFVAYSHRRGGTADEHTDDLLAILRRFDEPAHLVGFSTAIALRAVLRDSAPVRTLTIVEPNVPWLLEGDSEGEAVLAWWRDENKRVAAESAGDPDLAAKLWFELVDNSGRGTFDPQSEPFRRMWLDNFGKTRSAAAPAEPLTRDQLGSISVPTLVLGAGHGMPYSRSIVDRLAACVPGSRLVVIPDVTHFMSYQAPDVFNDVVLEFLGR